MSSNLESVVFVVGGVSFVLKNHRDLSAKFVDVLSLWTYRSHACLPHNSHNPFITLFFQGRFSEAEGLAERSHAILVTALGPDHPNIAVGLTVRAALLDSQVGSVGRETLGLPQRRSGGCN